MTGVQTCALPIPTGTITVNVVNTNWTSSGPETVDGSFPTGAALVPNPDGSLTVISGTFTQPGVFSIPTVPAGYYWLIEGLNLADVFDAFWTSSSTVDLGRDVPGPLSPATTKQNTTFNFNLAGLAPTSTASLVAISTDFTSAFQPGFTLSPAPEATTVSGTTTVDSIVDWSQVDTVFLAQYEPASITSQNNVVLNNFVLGPELTYSNPGFIDGGTNTITQTLQPSPSASLNLSVPGTQWAPLFNKVGPATALPVGSWLSVSAEPFVVGRNQTPSPFALNLPMVTAPPEPFGQPQLLPDFCLGGSSQFFGVLTPQPAIMTDANFGALDYGDPFPSSWTRAVAFCQQVAVEMPVVGSPGTSFPFLLGYGVAVPPSSSPVLSPLAEPVQNPTINGASLFTQSTLNTTVLTLSWTAPQGEAPYGYNVTALTQTAVQNGVEYSLAGQFGTAQTSATLPPLTAGQTYVFVIATEVDAAANMETSPRRSALPTGFANVVSAPITISSGAVTPAIQGNAKVFAELFRRRGKAFITSTNLQPAPNLQ